MKKYILGIFICLFSFFLMSHNVSAITSGSFIPNTAIGPFWVSRGASDPNGIYVCNTGSTLDYSHVIYTGLNFSRLEAGKDYLFAIPFFNPNENNAFDSKIPIQWRTSSDSNAIIKEVEIVHGSAAQSTLYMIVHSENYVSSGLLYFVSDDFIILSPGECVGNYGWFTRIEWSGIANYTDQLNALNNAIQNLNNNMPSQQSINNINNAVNNLNNTVQNRYDEEDQAMQDSQTDSSNDSSSSQSDVSSATTNLIGATSQVVSALTTTQATDCNIPMGFAHFGLGLVNVCSNVPASVLNIVRGVSALVFVPIIVNYALYLINKMIYLFRSFQG